MKNTTALLALVLVSCAGNTPDQPWICNTPGADCAEFVSGWTEADAMASCNPLASTFAEGECPSGRVAYCTATTATGRVWTLNYYAGFGDGSIAYALANCEAFGGSFTVP